MMLTRQFLIMKYCSFLAVIFLYCGNCPINASPHETEDYYLCANDVGGQWGAFGRIPRGCDVDPFGNPEFVTRTMSPLIFDDNQAFDSETTKYMDNLHASLMESASYYFSVRKPSASEEEITAWKQAIATVATVESYWSHYRHASDQRLKMIRGDSGHGHGMMQIDDRWHFVEIEDGVGWQLFENILYSFEIFYSAWEDAVVSNCVDSASNWRDRSRSAYSAYNGGPDDICRWNNEPGQWVQDSNYLDHYNQRQWFDVLSEPEATSQVDVICFLEGEEDCIPLIDNSPQADWYYQLLGLSNGHHCLFDGKSLHCVAQALDVVCLNVLLNTVSRNEVLMIGSNESDSFEQTFYERHVCLENVNETFKVADTIESVIAINIRSTAGGADTGIDSVAGKSYQVLDLVVTGSHSQHRYYKVKQDQTIGYIYAGSKEDYYEWVVLGDHDNLDEIMVPVVNDEVKVLATNGLSLRQEPDSDSELLNTITTNTELTVLDTRVIGSDNSIYIRLSVNGVEGWAYIGHLLPESTVSDWISFIDDTPPPPPPPQPQPDANNSGGGSIGRILLAGLLLMTTRRLWEVIYR